MVKNLILLSFFLCYSMQVFSAVYQCTDENGNVEFTDQPCTGETSQQEMRGGAKSFAQPILAQTPSSVSSVKEAIKYIGRNQLVTMNLDVIEQTYVVPGGSYQRTHSFIRKDRYSRSTPDHSIEVHFINGNGYVEYNARVFSHELSKVKFNRFFDARFSDVNNRMIAMGLDDKSKSGLTRGSATWRWQYRGFFCYTRASFGPTSSVQSVKAKCETRN